MSMTERSTTWLAAAAHATRGSHHLGAVVAAQLLANFELALTTEQRPYFTHLNLAARRGVRHRNTSRRIIAVLVNAGLIVRSRYRKIHHQGHANFSMCWGKIYAYVRQHKCRRMASRIGELASPLSPPAPAPLVIPRHTPPAPQPTRRAQADHLRQIDTSAERAAALASMRRSLFGCDHPTPPKS